MIHLKISNLPIDEISSQVLCLLVFSDIRPLRGRAGMVDWRLNGKFSKLILNSKFSGAKGETLLMPTGGRLDSEQLLWIGLGPRNEFNELEIPQLLTSLVEKFTLKKCLSFSLSLCDLTPGMFEWRNTIRLFISMLSGREQEMEIVLVEDFPFVEDAKRRNMGFSYDVQVSYELVEGQDE